MAQAASDVQIFALLNQPKAGDLYEISFDGAVRAGRAMLGYTLVKVERVDGDSVTLRFHKKIVPAEQGLSLIKAFTTAPGDFGDKIIQVSGRGLRDCNLQPILVSVFCLERSMRQCGRSRLNRRGKHYHDSDSLVLSSALQA